MEGFKKVTKAIIPVAGLGTRMLPATKAVPKELLPVLDKPLIQHVVEEAVNGGISEIILVTRGGKESIENHFDNNFELESLLKINGKKKFLNKFPKQTLKNISFLSIRQEKPLGLGHAILTAKKTLEKDEPFAVFLPDEFILAKNKVLDFQRMMKNYAMTGKGQILSERIKKDTTSNYGIMDLNKKSLTISKDQEIKEIIEKPSKFKAPSSYRVVGRYILPYEVMKYLEKTKPGIDDEIQLTDALQKYLKNNIFGLNAVLCNSQVFDCGSLKGFLGANVALASKDVYLKGHLRRLLKN
jgi:UTP--glucose-1-phosphate uridylyltransferase